MLAATTECEQLVDQVLPNGMEKEGKDIEQGDESLINLSDKHGSRVDIHPS